MVALEDVWVMLRRVVVLAYGGCVMRNAIVSSAIVNNAMATLRSDAAFRCVAVAFMSIAVTYRCAAAFDFIVLFLC